MFLATNFLAKVAQILGSFGGYFETHPFLSQNAVATFWATSGKFWATFDFNIWSRSLPFILRLFD